MPFDTLIGRCQVLDLTFIEDIIKTSDLEKLDIHSKMILLKTKNSQDKMLQYNPKHVSLGVDAAKYLVSKKITTIGYDYQSFEREGKSIIHRIFMTKDIICIDNLRLKSVKSGDYTLVCLPLKVTGIDAAPSRVILIRD